MEPRLTIGVVLLTLALILFFILSVCMWTDDDVPEAMILIVFPMLAMGVVTGFIIKALTELQLT